MCCVRVHGIQLPARGTTALHPAHRACVSKLHIPAYQPTFPCPRCPAAGDIPKVARQSFPLCMLTMCQALHDSHHLKHDGRMQFGLFLKVWGWGGVRCAGGRLLLSIAATEHLLHIFRQQAQWLCRSHSRMYGRPCLHRHVPLQGIGLPLEEAIRFWRTEMAPVRGAALQGRLWLCMQRRRAPGSLHARTLVGQHLACLFLAVCGLLQEAHFGAAQPLYPSLPTRQS